MQTSLRVMDPEDLNETDHEILEVLEGGRCNPGFIIEQTDLSKGTVHSHLRTLVLTDHVEKVHRGLYELADDPRGEE